MIVARSSPILLKRAEIVINLSVSQAETALSTEIFPAKKFSGE
jgi:hypothetical protein